MGATILFFSGLAVAAVWWLSTQRITSMPWLEPGQAGDLPSTSASSAPLAKVGLGILLASISALFALFISAYLMRMQVADWRAAPKPALLWVNTGLLMVSSAALQWARIAAGRGDGVRVRLALVGAGGAAVAFVIGQVVAWGQLAEAGYGLTSNPANSFFFLITALHGVHVLGGLVALGKSVFRAFRGRDPVRLRLGIDLCSLYWDFLLLMWLILFGLLLLT